MIISASVRVFTGYRSRQFQEQFECPNKATAWVQQKAREWKGFEVTTSILKTR